MDMYEDRFYEALNFLANIGIVKNINVYLNFQRLTTLIKKKMLNTYFRKCVYLLRLSVEEKQKQIPL